MKKFAKFLSTVISMALALAIGICFAACASSGSAGGVKEYSFCAAYVDVSGIDGAGWSGGGGGLGCVSVDVDKQWNSTEGFYITNLYKKGATLAFEITSDKEVSDAKIVVRLSAESLDYKIDEDTYKVTVNDEALKYGEISFTGVKALGQANKFRDYTVGTNVKLKQGKNVIKLITDNENSLGGTTEATAPVVDCIKITTSAALTWTPIKDNVSNF